MFKLNILTQKIGCIIFIIFSSIFYSIDVTLAGQGCCSWHRGEDYCDYDVGRMVCNDNTYSPSCGCPIIKTPSCFIKVKPSVITWGDSSLLSWSSSNATKIDGSNFDVFGLSGQKSIYPTFDTQYSLTVSNLRGTKNCLVNIKVNPKTEVKNEIIQQPVYVDDKTIEDSTQSSLTSVVVDEGLIGSKDLTYSVTYINGIETDRKLASEVVKIEPKEKIIKVGTMPPYLYNYNLVKSSFSYHKSTYLSILFGFILIILFVIGSDKKIRAKVSKYYESRKRK